MASLNAPQTGPDRSWPRGNTVSMRTNTLVLFVGSLVMVTIFDYNNADFFSSLFLFTFALLILMVIAGFARDAGVKEA